MIKTLPHSQRSVCSQRVFNAAGHVRRRNRTPCIASSWSAWNSRGNQKTQCSHNIKRNVAVSSGKRPDSQSLVSQDEAVVVGSALVLSTVAVIGILTLPKLVQETDQLYYFDYDMSFGDVCGSILWAVSYYYVSPVQLLLLFLGRIDTDRPSDMVKRIGGKLMGNDVNALGYEDPLFLKVVSVSLAVFWGVITAQVFELLLGDATWSVSTGIGACFAAFVYEVGRPERLSKDDAIALENVWQDFSSFADDALAKTGRCHESEVIREFRKRFGKYRTEDGVSDARIRDMIKNWNPEVKRSRNGYYQNISVRSSILDSM